MDGRVLVNNIVKPNNTYLITKGGCGCGEHVSYRVYVQSDTGLPIARTNNLPEAFTQIDLLDARYERRIDEDD